MNIYEAFTKAKNEGGYAVFEHLAMSYAGVNRYGGDEWRTFAKMLRGEWIEYANEWSFNTDQILSSSWQHVTELSQIEEKEG